MASRIAGPGLIAGTILTATNSSHVLMSIGKPPRSSS
jgi:hypothetical protein